MATGWHAEHKMIQDYYFCTKFSLKGPYGKDGKACINTAAIIFFTENMKFHYFKDKSGEGHLLHWIPPAFSESLFSVKNLKITV